GLADTVIGSSPATESAGVSTGVTFTPIDALGLTRALAQLLTLYADRARWTGMQKRAMKAEVGWDRAAAAYAALYAGLRA
ncbi:MAG: starch synthase, partial [Thermoleophilia bacterium]|nr:starch synthase [Thermoleophilia bacterium]